MKSALIVSIFAVCFISSCRLADEKPAIERILTFPAADVCRYPANSSIIKLHYLASESWTADVPDSAEAAYRCDPAERTVQLFGNGGKSVNVTYAATGDAKGATIITIEYLTSGDGPIENESSYRNVYGRFAAEIVRHSLGEPVPELAAKKILNLNSYSAAGGDAESFSVGGGFVTLERTRAVNNFDIRVELKIYSDKRLKLE